jgi:hypothetical protein
MIPGDYPTLTGRIRVGIDEERGADSGFHNSLTFKAYDIIINVKKGRFDENA